MADEVANAVNDSAVQDTAAADSAPAEEQQLEVVTEGPELNPNDFRDAEDEGPAEDVADDTDESDTAAETEAPQDGDKPLAPKSENRFQKLANENRELKAQLAAREAQVAQEQELLSEINPETGDYYTPVEAERIARAQYLETQKESIAQERSQIEREQTVSQLVNEANSVTSEISMLRETNPDGSKNPDYNPQVAEDFDNLMAENLLFQVPDGRVFTAAVLKANGIDPATQTLVGSYNSPYKLAKSLANAYEAAAVKAQIKGQKATEKMLAVSDNPTSAKPATTTADVKKMSAEEFAKANGMKRFE
jgi:hypothetical protein